ncbi:putative FlgJ-related protein [Nitrospirillum iridis]|uniref:Putative FlgJ-related protein n=2 Tax=Nitrospirillum iridis TaxID=765888 RepID=A0A7X0AZU5_9PROT|nr:putative FlgJ-related protein [Nitrospirillum iridis]
MDLEIAERKAFVDLLIEQIERENAQIAATRRR